MEKNYNKEIYIDNFYNNYKFEKLTTEKIIKIEKIEKLDNYKNVKSFSQLFNKPRQSLRQQISNLSPQEQALLYQFVQQQITQNSNRQLPQDNQKDLMKIIKKQDSTQDQSSQPQVTPSGRKYSADRMWSPFSTSGEIYEWNRGVIGIAFDGKVEKENLDGTYNHHADATIRVGNLLGANEQMIYEPFQAALNCNKYGMIILQSEGDNCFVYFPDTISVNQLSELSKVINPRQAFNFSYTHNEEIFEEQTSLDVINFATYLAKSQENQETTSTKISR